MSPVNDSSALVRTLSDMGNLFSDADSQECALRLVSQFARMTGGMGVALLLSDGDTWRVAASTCATTGRLQSDRINDGHPTLRTVGSAHEPVCVDFHPADAPFDPHALRALNAGFSREYALPLRHANRRVGAILLMDSADLPLPPASLDRLQSAAHVAAAGLARVNDVEGLILRNRHLELALESRIVIEQAKGVIAAQSNCDIATAFADLRQQARRARQPIEAVARATVQGIIPSVTKVTPQGSQDA